MGDPPFIRIPPVGEERDPDLQRREGPREMKAELVDVESPTGVVVIGDDV